MSFKHARRIIAILCIVILLFFLFFLWLEKKTPKIPSQSPTTSTSTSFGHGPSTVPVNPTNASTTGSNSISTASSSPIVLSSSDSGLIASCNSSISFERSDCIKKAAVEANKSSLCAAILGTFGQTDCKNSVAKITDKPVDVFSRAMTNYDFAFGTGFAAPANSSLASSSSQSSSSVSSRLGDALNKLSDGFKYSQDHPDSRYTAQGFFDRLRATPLVLFSFSEYQIAPGSPLTANGFGFAKTGNDVHIGGYTVSNLESGNGLTISFILPSTIPEGTYETWITNEKGSSRKDNQKIQLIVTNNPAPRPVITSVSPQNPSVSDTVTLTGEHLSGVIGLFTSLGVLKSVSSTESTITFNISDFDLVAKIRDLPTIKGKKIGVSVIAATPQGYNKDMFTFSVQF